MKKMKTPNLVTLAILTTITIIFWIFFSVYRVFASKPSTTIPPEILEPVAPTLDSETLDKISQGVYLPEEGIPTTTLSTSSPTPMALPTPTISPSPTASATASPTASPSATPTSLEQGT
jgi:hypothetical protein